MLKKHKKEILDLIQTTIIPLYDFSSEELEGDIGLNAFTITHMPTKFVFSIRNDPESFHRFEGEYTKFAPAFPLYDYPDEEVDDEYCNLSMLKYYFTNWILGISEYYDDQSEIDVWANLPNSKTFKYDTDNGANIDFTPEEKGNIRLAIRELKQTIEDNIELNANQLKILSDKLDYLTNAVDRLNKFDWTNFMIGLIMNISNSLLLNGENQKILISLVKSAFSSIKLLFSK